LRVKSATEAQRHAAVNWTISKIGLLYQDFFNLPLFGLKCADTNRSFPTADELYCMELLWAAYYNQGIDIDQDGWKFPWWVTGNDIIYDDDVEVVYKEVNDSTEITKPVRSLYVANRKIGFSTYFTIIIGVVDIEVSTENALVTRVDFYIDGTYKATDTTPPYSWQWNERGFGKKSIRAVAYDDEGNHYPTTIAVWKIF
jgi:hypothetical protein